MELGLTEGSMSSTKWRYSAEPFSLPWCWVQGFDRGTSLTRNRLLLGPYSRAMPRALWWPLGGGLFLMSEAPLYGLPSPPDIRGYRDHFQPKGSLAFLQNNVRCPPMLGA